MDYDLYRVLAEDSETALVNLALAYGMSPDQVIGKRVKLPRAWQAYEDKLKKDLGAAINAEATRIARSVDADGIFATSENVWKDFRANLLARFRAMFPQVASAAVKAARLSIGNIPSKVDWNLVNRKAENWAQTYSYDLVTNLTATSQRMLQEAFAKWIREGRGDTTLLRTMVFRAMVNDSKAEYGSDKIFTNRSNTIATTETTRIYAEANAKAYQEAGCGQAAFLPPAHVNCRCYIRPAKDPDGNWVMIWHTAFDEVVCKKEIRTQWGTVIGCKGMHLLCLSHGNYLGKRIG